MRDAGSARHHTEQPDDLLGGRVFTIARDRVRLPNGHETIMDVVRHGASVILIPMPDPTHVVLVRQYRYSIDRWVWELPAGTLEPDEDVETAARRECEEETGQVADVVERVGTFYPTPGYSDEQMIFFRLTGLTAPAEPAPLDADEILEPRVFAIDEARQLVSTADIIVSWVHGMAVSANGDLYLGDIQGRRVQKFARRRGMN